MSIKIFKNISSLLTLRGVIRQGGRHISEKHLGEVKQACLVVENGKVIALGSHKIAQEFQKSILTQRGSKSSLKKVEEIDLKGAVVMPAFVECHTHSLFVGHRFEEFELRNQGWSYEAIAKRGGGILSTMKATRKAKKSELLSLAQQRVNQFIRQGVTTLEVKSGYGLDFKSEEKLLEVASQLKGPDIIKTYLGPHAIPNNQSSAQYIQTIIQKDLPRLVKHQRMDRADIFIDKGFFTVADGEKYIKALIALGIPFCIHGEQLNRTGATDLGVLWGAQSIEHVIKVNARQIQKLAASETVAVLLPCADFYLGIDYPPARKLIEAGVVVALATDFNPGSSPTQSIQDVGVFARLKMKMSLPETIAAYTYNAAKSLGLESVKGALAVGYDADFVCLEGPWQSIFYSLGANPVTSVWKKGRRLKTSEFV